MLVTIEIDGKKVQARSGAMVIEAADELGIRIPRFCYHKKLSIAANCRMCLVEVEKAAKPLPACATPVTEGMRIFTKSRKALDAQKAVMEFLLINHPLDCPICDQGGECELQDVAMGYGRDVSRFAEKKRVVKDKNLGPLISTDMTRCIHCTRCVRFGEEIAGLRELGATGRGEHMEIGTYIEKAVQHELSGNVIDLCPVGALTNKPFRFSARAWEMRQFPTIAAHDCVGSNLNAHIGKNKVLRMVPRDNELVNETWISDRDRFGFEGVNSDDRLRVPMIKQNGQWKETDWTSALDFVATGLGKIASTSGVSEIGALCSPSSTVEEMYLLQRFIRGLGSGHVDHRLRQTDFSDQDAAPLYPSLGQSIEHLETVDAALVIGADIRRQQPLLAHRLRMAALDGANVMFLGSVGSTYQFPVAANVVVDPRCLTNELAGVAKALLKQASVNPPAGFAESAKAVQVSADHEAIAKALKGARNATVLLGTDAIHHPDLSTLRSLASLIAQLTDAKLGYMTEGANAAGAWLAGMVPHRGPSGSKGAPAGSPISEMLRQALKAYVLLGVEPDKDCGDVRAAMKAMRDANFVVALTAYQSPSLEQVAHVMLPVAPFTETSGTFVNAEGRWQSFAGAVAPQGDARPAWKVLRVLGNVMHIDGFEFMSSEEVRDELRTRVGNAHPDNKTRWHPPRPFVSVPQGFTRVTLVAPHSVDAIVRRSDALQQTTDAPTFAALVSDETARELSVREGQMVAMAQGGNEITMPVRLDARVPRGCVLVYAGQPGAEHLDPSATLTVRGI